MDKLIDIYGNEYIVQDITAFKEHIFKYHTHNGEPDGSIHEENGFYFNKDKKRWERFENDPEIYYEIKYFFKKIIYLLQIL